MMFRCLCFLFFIGYASLALAQPLTPQQVPEPLKPWIAWVSEAQPERACPFAYSDYAQKYCVLAQDLSLVLTAKKGTFNATWQVYAESWLTLVGDSVHWPLNVTVNDKPALVMERDGLPAVKVPAGTQQIKGEFLWHELPDSLHIPDNSGVIHLQVDGKAIAVPTLKDGAIWLADEASASDSENKAENIQNNVSFQVFRKIDDDVPVSVLTYIDLNISGAPREIVLNNALLPEFIPMQLHSGLPVRLNAQGQLIVQARAGGWQIQLMARNHKELTSLTLAQAVQVNEASTSAVEPSEIWLFAAHSDLRVVEITQLSAIDASQTNVPEVWRKYPAYKISAGQTMGFNVLQRGNATATPNQLNLTRKLWLDFDGGGYTVNDVINGTMTSGWRLNALPSTALGKVTLDGNSQLITQYGDKQRGVEVRKGVINLAADSRVAGDIDALSAVGWQHDFHNVSAELYLPPGWQLLAASGVDNVPDCWLSRWTLLDLFLVLIIALAVGRLWQPLWGVLALLTLAMSWHEDLAPQFIWLNLLATIALLRVLPSSKFSKLVRWYRNACYLSLVILLVPFMIAQVRIGIYPQLALPWQDIHTTLTTDDFAAMQTNQVAQDSLSPQETKKLLRETQESLGAAGYMPKAKALSRAIVPESSYDNAPASPSAYRSDYLQRTDPKAKVQTGPGLPQWQWRTVQLSWNGTVTAEQQLNLWYSSPTLTMLGNFLRVILLSLLSLVLIGAADKWRLNLPRFTAPPSLLLALVLLPLLLHAPKANAEFPNEALLNQLRDRLQSDTMPDCLPSCGQIQQMQIALNEKTLVLTLQIHAQERVVLPLPSDNSQWLPNDISDNGKTALAFSRDNQLWLSVGQGQHTVILKGNAPPVPQFSLLLPLKPHHVELAIDEAIWNVIGIQDDGQLDEQLQFSRLGQTDNTAPETAKPSSEQDKPVIEQSPLPPFVRVERTLQLGLDWRVVTEINRVTPADVPLLVNIPLLKGESVLTSGIRVKNNAVEVNMAAQETTLRWESTLEKSQHIELRAPDTTQWQEVWRADISPIWHSDNSGIAMMHLNSDGHWLPEWHPWSGESVTLHVTRPEAIVGNTLTIDNSTLQINQGQRLREVTLTATVRSSQGLQHTMTLPQHAQLQRVSINGISQPLRQDGRKLTLPISPSKQQLTISWQEAVAVSPILTTPLLDMGQDSVNHNITLSLGANRWVLFASGPRFGPIILFWGMLVVMLIVAVGLGKVRLTPLKHWQWFLLLIGLSQVAIESAIVVIAWLMLLGWRQHAMTRDSDYFNLLQATLSLITLVSLGILFAAVAQGLLDAPDMQITGNQSSAFTLNWYADRSPAQLPTATVFSLPLLVYRLLMLAWSLWLAVSLLNWLKWGWACFSENGLWFKAPPKVVETAETEKK